MVLGLLHITSARAVVSYNFDFGPTAYLGTDGGPAGLILNSGDWTRINDDNSQTVGPVTVDLGRGAGASEETTVSWVTAVKSATADFPAASRLDVPNLYEDGMGGSVSRTALLGIRISGLAPGLYDVCATLFLKFVRDLSTATGSVYLGTGDSTVNQPSQILNATSLPWSGFSTNAAAFVATPTGWNFISNQVSVTAGQYVILIAELPFAPGHNTNADEPLISTMQLVMIPEPSTFTLAGAGLDVAASPTGALGFLSVPRIQISSCLGSVVSFCAPRD